MLISDWSSDVCSSDLAARRGRSFCLLEKAGQVGGALLINRGQLSGAGTKLQAQRGIVDTAQDHYDDAMRISKGTSDSAMLELAVRLQGPLIDWLMDHGFEMEEIGRASCRERVCQYV